MIEDIDCIYNSIFSLITSTLQLNINLYILVIIKLKKIQNTDSKLATKNSLIP